MMTDPCVGLLHPGSFRRPPPISTTMSNSRCLSDYLADGRSTTDHGCDEKRNSFDIGDEYKSTLRSKSYENMLKDLRTELNPASSERRGGGEEEQETLVPRLLRSDLLPATIETPVGGVLRDYIERGAVARRFCHMLLKSIDGARAHIRLIHRVVALHKSSSREQTTEQRRRMLSDVGRFADLDNPLSQPELVNSPATRGVYAQMIPRLRSLHRRVAGRRALMGSICRKASRMAVVTCGARGDGGESRRRWLQRISRRLDAAARGAYALDREFDTVGTMLARLNTEVEHGREVVTAFLQNRPESYHWRELVSWLQREEKRLLDQLQEMEEHAYLCLLTIKRSGISCLQELIDCQELNIELE